MFGARIAITNLSWLPIIFLGGVIGDAIGCRTFLVIAGLITLGDGSRRRLPADHPKRSLTRARAVDRRGAGRFDMYAWRDTEFASEPGTTA